MVSRKSHKLQIGGSIPSPATKLLYYPRSGITNCMSDDSVLDPLIQVSIYRLMLTLYNQGITEIHMGGLMRILGMSDTIASQHDEERVIMDEDFARYMYQMTQPRYHDQPLH